MIIIKFQDGNAVVVAGDVRIVNYDNDGQKLTVGRIEGKEVEFSGVAQAQTFERECCVDIKNLRKI